MTAGDDDHGAGCPAQFGAGWGLQGTHAAAAGSSMLQSPGKLLKSAVQKAIKLE
jgi:hypothetical protein